MYNVADIGVEPHLEATVLLVGLLWDPVPLREIVLPAFNIHYYKYISSNMGALIELGSHKGALVRQYRLHTYSTLQYIYLKISCN